MTSLLEAMCENDERILRDLGKLMEKDPEVKKAMQTIYDEWRIELKEQRLAKEATKCEHLDIAHDINMRKGINGEVEKTEDGYAIYEDGGWTIYGIKFCPFCGEKIWPTTQL